MNTHFIVRFVLCLLVVFTACVVLDAIDEDACAFRIASVPRKRVNQARKPSLLLDEIVLLKSTPPPYHSFMSEKSIVKDCQTEIAPRRTARVGFDALDQLAVASLPEFVMGDALPHAMAAMTEITETGPSGPAMHRLLSREVQLSRAALRFTETLRNLEATRFLRGDNNVRRLEVAEKLLVDSHRRMVATIECFARVAGGLPPRISVTAHQAVVAVGGPQ